jgi:hypothetical protein
MGDSTAMLRTYKYRLYPSKAQTRNLYPGLQAQGLGGEGNHALVKALENLAGIKVGSDEKK